MSSVSILFQDEDLLAVDKPAGWLSVPGKTMEKQDCLYGWLRLHFPELLVVHRLDRDTSGIMLFARNRQAQSELGRRFGNRQVRKDYIAWVNGRLRLDSGQIDRPLGRVARGGLPPRYQVDEQQGKPAQTRWACSVGRQIEHACGYDLSPDVPTSYACTVCGSDIPLWATPSTVRIERTACCYTPFACVSSTHGTVLC